MGVWYSDLKGDKKHAGAVAPRECFDGVRKTDIELKALERYLKINDNVNRYCGSCGGTLLQCAVRNRQVDVVSLLLLSGANTFKNNDGCCPLDIAKERGYYTIVRLIEDEDKNWQLFMEKRALPDFAYVRSSCFSSQPDHAADSQLLPSAPPLPILRQEEEEWPNWLGASSSSSCLSTSSSYTEDFSDYIFTPANPGRSYWDRVGPEEEDADDEEEACQMAMAIMVSLEPELQEGIIPQLLFWRNEPTGEASSSNAPFDLVEEATGSHSLSSAPQTPNGSSGTRECEYCCDAPIEATCDPCGHVACCNCWVKIQDSDNKCPYCRVPIQKIIKLFM